VAVVCGPALLVQGCWRADPALRATPLAIAPPDGQILAACPLAIDAGVRPEDRVAQARLRCPDLTIRPPDDEAALALYERLLDALATCSPAIEATDSVVGVAYLAARGLARLWGSLQGVAQAAVRAASSIGLTVSAGIGPTRLVALALAMRTTPESEPPLLLGDAAAAFLRDLPLDTAALSVPPTAVETLCEVGIATAGMLARLPRAGLALRYGPEVLAAWHAARGLPEAPLLPWTPLARMTVMHRDEEGLADRTILEALLRRLAERLALQLQARAQATATLTLSLRSTDGAEHLRRTRHWPPLHTLPALTVAALDLLSGSQPPAPVEVLDLQALDLVSPAIVQHSLWDDAARDRRDEQLAAVLQTHARRHGRNVLRRWRPDPLALDGWSCEEGAAGQ
jgi:protein ImuB